MPLEQPIGQSLTPLPSLEVLVSSPDELESFDIAALNFLSAQGLPGTDKIDLATVLDRLDDWAHRAKLQTAKQMHRFAWMSQQPQTDYTVGDSLGRFCCYCLLETLQVECGVRYNPSRKFKPNFCLPADLFIHGIVDEHGEGGTCASMPIVYVAIARRLGYPVFLAQTKGHVYFCWRSETPTRIEWESPPYSMLILPDRFNVEGSGEGIGFLSDAHYIQWPELWKAEDFEYGRYLRPLTPKEELASFLVQRCCCLEDLHRYEEALQAVFNARRLCPKDAQYRALHVRISSKCIEAEIARHESVWQMDELRREVRMQPRVPPGGVVKVAFGKPPPDYLPPGTPVKYVRPEDADPAPPPPTDSWGMPISTAQRKIQEQNRRLQRWFDREALMERLIEQYKVDPFGEARLEEE